MKKFLIFLVSIVVVVCLGLTTFYFLKNDEVITIATKELYCNAGDTISLETLGITRKKANRKTTFDYNAGGERVTSAIRFDDEKGYFVVDGETSGDIDLVIKTSNKRYAEFKIKVHVGNGEQETPYYIFDETDLARIGSVYGLADNYKLMNDITLSSSFQPIGSSNSTWVGFSGGFDGNGFTIKGLNLTGTYPNAGFFSSINAGAIVTNLSFNNATISGSYEKAGVLAGEISGLVNRVVVTNANLTNLADNGFTGALAGVHNSQVLKMAYADNVTINVGSESAVTNATVGGLFGKVNQSTIQATYVNNATINVVADSTGKFGGYAGEFVIGTQAGSIQQSYANTVSENSNYGSFIGEISTTGDFAGTSADMIRYLIGNAVVTNGKDVVKTYDSFVFTSFKNESKSAYLISSYQTANDMIMDSENLVYYAISSQNKTLWDTTYIWKTANSYLPTLKMGNIEPASPSGEYFRKDLVSNEVNEEALSFANTFSSDKENEKFNLTSDVVLTDWTPVNLTNCTIDGAYEENGTIKYATITLSLDNANDNNLGLFAKLDNCTIKNVNIIITDVTENASNVGALAGIVTSSDSVATSTIENVNVTFQNVSNITAINFGGLVAVAEKTNIVSTSVTGLTVSANIANVGGLVADLGKDAVISGNTNVEATVTATDKVGGLVAINAGAISGVNLTAVVNYNSNVENANVGGIVATNSGTINNVTADVTININSANGLIYVGGVAGINTNEISSTEISGAGITLADINANIYVGGVVADNSGKIEDVENYLTTVGTYQIGKNYKVGGVAYRNSGNIARVVTTSNVYGNYVAGVIVEMNNAGSTIDQVLVANYADKTISENEIKGDKYVAGIVVDFRAGNITNIQASSSIVGAANTTRSSLVALIFPYGANLKNATISSSLSGYGKFYKETWKDFSTYSNKAEFGYSDGEAGYYDSRFNLYNNDTHHGSMQSVVIDSSKTGVSSAQAAMGEAFAFGNDYTNSSESSYIKTVNGFTNISQFQGSFTFVCATSAWFKIEHEATKTLTFAVGTTWEDNGSGISLIFLNNLD